MAIFNRHRHLRPEVLSEYLDGRLDQRHQEQVARRLADCPACREELHTLQTTVSALQSLPDLPLPRSFILPTAPSPDYPANLIRKPAPLVMKMPAWAYGSAASLAAESYYRPTERGFEREVQKRLDYWRKLRDKRAGGGDGDGGESGG